MQLRKYDGKARGSCVLLYFVWQPTRKLSATLRFLFTTKRIYGMGATNTKALVHECLLPMCFSPLCYTMPGFWYMLWVVQRCEAGSCSHISAHCAQLTRPSLVIREGKPASFVPLHVLHFGHRSVKSAYNHSKKWWIPCYSGSFRGCRDGVTKRTST